MTKLRDAAATLCQFSRQKGVGRGIDAQDADVPVIFPFRLLIGQPHNSSRIGDLGIGNYEHVPSRLTFVAIETERLLQRDSQLGPATVTMCL